MKFDLGRAVSQWAKILLEVDKPSRAPTIPGVANKRKADKAFIGGYVNKTLKRKFKALAKQEAGGDAVKMLHALIIEGLERRGIRVIPPKPKNKNPR